MTQPTFFYEARGPGAGDPSAPKSWIIITAGICAMRQTYCCRRITSPGWFLISAGRFLWILPGIGILLNRYKQMQRSGGSVAIYGVGVQINRILNLGGI